MPLQIVDGKLILGDGSSAVSFTTSLDTFPKYISKTSFQDSRQLDSKIH